MNTSEQEYLRLLEEAVLEAECVLADGERAKWKGYLPHARKTVFEAAKHIRRMRGRNGSK